MDEFFFFSANCLHEFFFDVKTLHDFFSLRALLLMLKKCKTSHSLITVLLKVTVSLELVLIFAKFEYRDHRERNELL